MILLFSFEVSKTVAVILPKTLFTSKHLLPFLLPSCFYVVPFRIEIQFLSEKFTAAPAKLWTYCNRIRNRFSFEILEEPYLFYIKVVLIMWISIVLMKSQGNVHLIRDALRGKKRRSNWFCCKKLWKIGRGGRCKLYC